MADHSRTSSPAGPRHSAGRPRRNPLALLVAAAVVAGLVPTVGLAAPAAAEPQATPAPATTTGSSVGVIDPSVVRIVSPRPDTLVGGAPLRARVWLAPGTTAFVASTDEGRVTSSFRRVGRERVGLLRLPAGTNTLVVTVQKNGKTFRARTPITVKGRLRDLLAAAPVLPELRSATPGVKPIAIRVEPTATTTATLNGKPVDLRRRAGAARIRDLVLSPDDGLRSGANEAVVQSFRNDGQWESMRWRFVVPAGIPLAEAGDHRQVRHGQKITLDATRSRPGTTRPGGPRGRLSYQWRLTRAPAGVTASALPSGAKASVTLSTPGEYRFAMTVTARRGARLHRSTDTVSATAVASAPAMGVRLATFVHDPAGKSTELGLQKGALWYPWSQYFAGKPAGVFAFDARTLDFPMTADGKSVVKPKGLAKDTFYADLDPFLTSLGSDALLVFMYLDSFTGQYMSRVVAWDGPHNGDNRYVTGAGTANNGLTLSDPSGQVQPAGGLSGHLRYSTDDGRAETTGNDPYATGLFRFVQDGELSYSTSTSRTATGGIADGATYQLAVPSRFDTANQVVGRSDLEQPAVLQPPTGALDQQWELVRAYGDYYELVNRAGGCLNLSGSDYSTVLVWPCTGRHVLNELWTPRTDSSGFIRLQSAQRPLTPTPDTDDPEVAASYLTRKADGGLVVGPYHTAGTTTSDQLWTWRIPGGVYSLTGSVTGQAAAEADYAGRVGDQLRTAAVTGGLEQQWRVVPRQGDEFGLQNLASGLCMAVGGNGADGAAVVRATCDPDDATQDWSMSTNSDGAYLQSGVGLYLATADDGRLVHQGFDPSFPAQAQPVWSLSRHPEPTVGGAYAIVHDSGRTVQIGSDNASLSATAAKGALARQDWVLREASRTQPGTGLVQLYNRTTNTCLNRPGDPRFPTSPEARPCVGWEDGSASTWRLASRDDGGYRLEAATKSGEKSVVLTTTPEGTLLTAGARDDAVGAQQWQLVGRPVTMTVGNGRWTSSLPVGSAGFVVLAIDAAARPVAGYPRSYWTNGASGNQPDQDAMGNDLKQLAKQVGVTVLVQSVGRPWPTTASWNGMADGIAAVNLARGAFLQLDGRGDYAAAGCGLRCTDSAWVSESVRRELDPSVVGARLEGSLRRNASAVLGAGGAAAALDTTFSELAERAAQPWPLADTQAGRDALGDIAGRLQLPQAGTCGSGTGLDAVRNSYCLLDYDQTVDWSTKRNTLLGSGFGYQPTDKYDATVFATARVQLAVEFEQLQQVHSLMAGIRSFYRDANNPLLTGTAATTMADEIKRQLPTKRVSKSHVGGWLALTSESLDLLKGLGPLLAARPGANEQKEPEKEKFSAADTVITSLALAGEIVDMVGDNDSETEGIDDEIVADADHYAEQLDKQADVMIDNLLTVENLLVTDRVKLEVAATSGSGGWNMTTSEASAAKMTLREGMSRNLMLTLFPTAYEMWSWPSLTYQGQKPTGILCNSSTAPLFIKEWHPMYEGTDPDAMYQLPKAVRADGSPSPLTTTWVLTPVTMEKVNVNSDRTLRAGLRSYLAQTTGFARREGDTWRIAAAQEFLAALPVAWRNYPDDMDLSGTDGGHPGSCAQRIPDTGAIEPF